VEDAPIELEVLGPLVVRVEGEPVALGRRARQLLLSLLTRRGTTVPADTLAELVWPDGPPTDRRNALQAQVSRLRRALGVAAGCLTTEPTGYRLTVPAGSVDADRLRDAVRVVRDLGPGEDPAGAAWSLRAALEAWRGDPLAEGLDDPSVVVEASQLAELHLEAVELLAEASLAIGAGSGLVAELRSHADDHPTRERLHRGLAHALYRAGRQQEALEVLAHLQHRLRDELGVDPDPTTVRLHRAILEHDPSLRSTRPTRTAALARLPEPRTSFVGREQELGELRQLLDEGRLITLIGPGGTGKTRLALEAARRFQEGGQGEAALVELASLTVADDVLPHVAATLGVGPSVGANPGVGSPSPRPLEDRLTAHLAGRRLLVVLDNCEHLIAAAAAVADRLLDASPTVQVLATGREALRLPGEVRIAVRPLPLPHPSASDPVGRHDGDAVQLFLDRARAVAPAFAVDTDGTRTVTEICRRLDGLPLAIELAAARVATLPIELLAERLSDRFRLLTSGDRTVERQRTLGAVVAWSYDLLDDRQRAVLRRLSVFSGPAALELAEVVCAGGDVAGDDVLPTIAELGDRSLLSLVPTVGGGSRVRLLETIRDYARLRLAEEGDLEAVRTRHALGFADRAQLAAVGLQAADQLAWLARLEQEHDDLRAALACLLDDQPARALRMACDLAWFWWLREQIPEGRGWVERGLAVAGDEAVERALGWGWVAFLRLFDRSEEADIRDAITRAELALDRDAESLSPADRAMVMLLTAYVRLMLGHDPPRAVATMAAAADMARATGESWVESAAHFALAVADANAGRAGAALDHAGRAHDLAERSGDRWARFQSMQLTAMLHVRAGDYAAARADLAAAAELAEEVGAREQARGMRCQHALACMLDGDVDGARSELEEIRARSERDGPVSAVAMYGLGLVAHRVGDEEQAIEHHRVAADRFLEDGFVTEAAEALCGLAFARARLGDADAASAAATSAAALLRGQPDTTTRPLVVEAAAAAAQAAGDAELALRRLGHAAGLREPLGATLVAGERFDVDWVEAGARAELGAPAADAALAAGRDDGQLLDDLA
jgi:predicted ATPase/DNA-binding SARP family transcriptional activator